MGRAVRAAVAGILIGLFLWNIICGNGSTEKIIQREKQR